MWFCSMSQETEAEEEVTPVLALAEKTSMVDKNGNGFFCQIIQNPIEAKQVICPRS